MLSAAIKDYNMADVDTSPTYQAGMTWSLLVIGCCRRELHSSVCQL